MALTPEEHRALVETVTEVVLEVLGERGGARAAVPPPAAGAGPSMATLEAMGIVHCDGGQCRACGRCAH